MKPKAILTVILSVAILAAAVLTLPGCGALANRESAAAERLRAEAALERARASAARAEADAMAERASARQFERDASHERTLEILPFVLLIAGLVTIGALAVVALGGGVQRRQVDPGVVFLLKQQDQRLQELERATWHAIATEQRRQLMAGVGHQVIVDDVEGRVITDE